MEPPGLLKRSVFALAFAVLVVSSASTQHYQTDFPAEEFKARHAQVFEQIGDERRRGRSGRATRRKASRFPRQHNTFYYLCGIETPGAYLLLDGRAKKVTIYLPRAQSAARSRRRTRALG